MGNKPVKQETTVIIYYRFPNDFVDSTNFEPTGHVIKKYDKLSFYQNDNEEFDKIENLRRDVMDKLFEDYYKNFKICILDQMRNVEKGNQLVIKRGFVFPRVSLHKLNIVDENKKNLIIRYYFMIGNEEHSSKKLINLDKIHCCYDYNITGSNYIIDMREILKKFDGLKIENYTFSVKYFSSKEKICWKDLCYEIIVTKS